MPVRVVGIGHMGMGVRLGPMLVPMAVAALRHRGVGVVVVPVVVPVCVFVLSGLVVMRVLVRFGQVQHHPGHHQQRRAAVPQDPRLEVARGRRSRPGHHRSALRGLSSRLWIG